MVATRRSARFANASSVNPAIDSENGTDHEVEAVVVPPRLSLRKRRIGSQLSLGGLSESEQDEPIKQNKSETSTDDDDFVNYVPPRRRKLTTARRPESNTQRSTKRIKSIPKNDTSTSEASSSSSPNTASELLTHSRSPLIDVKKEARETRSAAVNSVTPTLPDLALKLEEVVKGKKRDLGESSLSSAPESPSLTVASSSTPSLIATTPLTAHDAELESSASTSLDEDEDEDEDDEQYSSSDNDPVEPITWRRRGRGRGRGRGGGRGRARPEKLAWHKRTNLKLVHQHPELQTVWDDLRSTDITRVEHIEQPENLKLSLLPFQKYGVAWMMQQEKVEAFKGGILADEMGMGKTIQTISLLLSDFGNKPNLVVAPAVAIIQWQTEIQTHTKNNVKIHIFHGARRSTSVEDLRDYDVVITTYSVAESSFRRQEHGVKREGQIVKEKSLLHKVEWHRIILDEAHCIKDRSCNTARSVFALKGKYKWSLTGTPLQNRVGELYSLIRFMEADPYGYYFCTKCDCKSIHWKFKDNRSCDTCGHTPMQHVCWWNNEVLKPIQVSGYVGDGREAMQKLGLLLDRMMLRRTKLQCADDLGLPPRTITVRSDYFNEAEEEVYLSLFTDTARRFNDYIEDGSVLNNYANIFELLTKMRQCANHPDLVTKKKGKAGNKQLVCMLCNDTPEDAINSACRHTFCRECCIQYLRSFDDAAQSGSPKCPSCYANFSVDLTQPTVEIEGSEGEHTAFSKSSIVNRIDMEKWRSSTKIEALVEELSKLRTEDRSLKSIVFSQFVSFLDLVYWRLSRLGFSCIRLDGTMSPQQRATAIEHFSTNPRITVFLISLKAGGVALNLTEANRVFICDPWWNPSAELQAMDRIHRLGQYRPIRITRLVIENSIESRIIQLQEKKTALVNSTIDKDESAFDRLTVEDLKFLFVM